MGNDGGFIPTRDCLAKQKDQEVKIDNTIRARDRALLCQLSKNILKSPVAMCRIGYLYNYEAIVERLTKKNIPKEFSHIKKLKDVKVLKVEEIKDKNSKYRFICPLTQKEFNGMHKFIALWTCGCVFSKQMQGEINEDKGVCPVCGKQYSITNDLVNLNENEEEMQLKQRQMLNDQQKKQKKPAEKKQDKKLEKNHNFNEQQPSQEEEEPNFLKKQKISQNEQIVELPKSSLIQKILETQEEINKSASENVKSLFHNDKDSKKEEVGFFRNVRHGIR